MITHIHADYADKKDSQCLAELIEGLKENLHPERHTVEQVLADTGYSSGEALKAVEQNKITGYILNFGKYKPERQGSHIIKNKISIRAHRVSKYTFLAFIEYPIENVVLKIESEVVSRKSRKIRSYQHQIT